jgi:hypothetical protein
MGGGRLDRRSISCSHKGRSSRISWGAWGLSALGLDPLLYDVMSVSFEGWLGPSARPVRPVRPVPAGQCLS